MRFAREPAPEPQVVIMKVWHDSRRPLQLDGPMPRDQAEPIAALLNDLAPDATYVLRLAGAT